MVKTSKRVFVGLTVVLGAALALSSLTANSAAARQRSDITLRVAVYSGPFTDGVKKYASDVFAKHMGIKVEYINANPSDFVLQKIAACSREAPYDIVVLDAAAPAQAMQAGLLAKLDPALMLHLQFLYPDARYKDDYGAGVQYYSMGIAYNKAKLKEAGIPEPTSWQDLWVARLAWHIAIPEIATIMGRGWIIAAAKLNNGSGSSADKGIEKLAQIKAHSYYTSSSTLAAQVQWGDVWVMPWNNMRTWVLIDNGLPIGYALPKDGRIGNIDYLDLAAGSLHPREAQMLINYAPSPLAQLGKSTDLSDAPANRLLGPVIAAYPEMARIGPMSANDVKKLYLPDWAAFDKDLPKLTNLWNREIHK